MIINRTKSKTLTIPVDVADSFLKRFRGLMLVRNIDRGLLFYLPRKSRLGASIHMFFMLSSIDVVWLDEGFKVVDFVENLKPWRVAVPRAPAKYILELPAGAINELSIGVGDVLEVEVLVKRKRDTVEKTPSRS